MSFFKIFLMIFTFAFLYCFFSSNAIAELYSYTDDFGIVHYTDDYSSVPEKYKNKINITPEIKTAPFKKPDPEVSLNTNESLKPAALELKKEAEQLIERKKTLDLEYQSILKSQKELEEARLKVKTKKQKKEYVEKVEKLNLTIKQYEEKTSEYNRSLELYNKKAELVE